MNVEILVEDGKVKEVHHDGRGCSICCSSASVMTETLKGKTFNGVNATLAAAAGKGLCTKAKGVLGDKMLTVYTITDAGRAVIAPADADAEEAVEGAE